MKQCMENATKLCPDYPEKCTKCGAYREQTNADRIRTMSDEELAKMLWETGRNYRAICADPVVDFREHYGDLLQWLRKPAEEDE